MKILGVEITTQEIEELKLEIKKTANKAKVNANFTIFLSNNDNKIIITTDEPNHYKWDFLGKYEVTYHKPLAKYMRNNLYEESITKFEALIN